AGPLVAQTLTPGAPLLQRKSTPPGELMKLLSTVHPLTSVRRSEPSLAKEMTDLLAEVASITMRRSLTRDSLVQQMGKEKPWSACGPATVILCAPEVKKPISAKP